MGGKRKMLTQTRRKMLGKEMMDAVMAGQFTLNNRPLEEVLDEVDQGIKDDRYPIEVDLPTLIGIWSGNPAPSAPEPAPEQPAPVNHGTVDQIQAAQANGYRVGQPEQYPVPQQVQGIPTNVHVGDTVNGMPAEQWQAQQVAMGHGPTAEQARGLGLPPGSPVVQQPSPLAAAVGVAPGMQVPTAVGPQTVQQVPAQPMTFQQAQAAMQAAETLEVGEPPKPEPIAVDASPVAEWIGLARQAQAKIDKLKDIVEQAKANASAYADQVGGPDCSKILMIEGRQVMRRTYVTRRNLAKDRLLAAHPEIDAEAFTDTTSFYKTELL